MATPPPDHLPDHPPAHATARAPGRVNLIGEHTDYNDGLCLPLAIPYDTVARIERRGDDRVILRSEGVEPWEGSWDDLGPGRVQGWAAYAGGTLWALAQAGHDLPGLELDVTSTVPRGAGLSSSAALEAAVAVAAATLVGRELTDELRRELVEVCRRAEGEVVGAPTGGLDQTAVLRVEDGSGVLIDFADASLTPVALPLAEAGLTLLVIDTRVSHALTDGGYGSRREECERAAASLGLDSLRDAEESMLPRLDDVVLRGRARHVVTENQRVAAAVDAITGADWRGLGRLLDDSHTSMRDDFEISCDELDLVVSTARQAGALGARMTGGGFGGSAIALVPTERADACRHAIDVAFVVAGFAAPAHLLGTPSAPASVVERG